MQVDEEISFFKFCNEIPGHVNKQDEEVPPFVIHDSMQVVEVIDVLTMFYSTSGHLAIHVRPLLF